MVPAKRLSARVAVRLFESKVHPEPVIEATVMPAGGCSVTVTVPLLAAPPILETVTTNEPASPCRNVPPETFEMLRSGPEETAAAATAVLLRRFPSPPPERVTLLVKTLGAFSATATLTAIGG